MQRAFLKELNLQFFQFALHESHNTEILKYVIQGVITDMPWSFSSKT